MTHDDVCRRIASLDSRFMNTSYRQVFTVTYKRDPLYTPYVTLETLAQYAPFHDALWLDMCHVRMDAQRRFCGDSPTLLEAWSVAYLSKLESAADTRQGTLFPGAQEGEKS